MLQVILSTIAIFIGSSIEEIPVFVLLFSRAKNNSDKNFVSIGIIVANIIIISASIALAILVGSIPNEKIIGIIGIIPLAIGIAVASGFEGKEEKKLNKILEKSKGGSLMLESALVTLALAADDVAVYIPFFLSIDNSKLIVSFITLIILVAMQCYLSAGILKIKSIADFLEKYERVIVPLVFIPLGLYIMYKYGVFSFIK